MGLNAPVAAAPQPVLSVLALSSRFDGAGLDTGEQLFHLPFSTRSVESF